MKDFELTLRVRNNRLKQRREELGLSQKKLAAAAGVNLNAYGALECMRISPREKDGLWSKFALKLAAFHCVDPGELFPPTIQAVKQPVAVRKMDADDISRMLTSHQQRMIEAPDTAYDRAELSDQVDAVLSSLTQRMVDVLRCRFGLDGRGVRTYDELAKRYGVETERIRQIEAKALRLLRHPTRSKKLKIFHFERDWEVNKS